MSSQEGTLDKLLNDLTDNLTDNLTEEEILNVLNLSDDELSEENEALDEQNEISEDVNILEEMDIPEIIEESNSEDELTSLLQDSNAEVMEDVESSESPESEMDIFAPMFVNEDGEELSMIRDLDDKEQRKIPDEQIDQTSQNEPDEKKRLRAAQKEAKRAEKLAKKEAKRAEKLAKREGKRTKDGEQALQRAVPTVGAVSQKADAMTDDLGIADILADIPIIGETESSSEELSAEDALFADIESLNLFEDEGLGIGQTEGLDDLTDNIVEDSLKQIVKDEKKKKSFLNKVIDFMTEEEEEENENSPISEENREILKEMDKEDKKKKKNKKMKKGKKPETSEQTDSEDGEGTEKEKAKNKKNKKEKKPKKEKAPKVEAVDGTGESNRRLSKKGVMVILAACMSVGIILVLCIIGVGDSTVKKAGRQAYYAGDYETCYQNLFGKTLNESEQVMYCKSQNILTLNMWIREYEILAQEGSEREALDSLLQSVYDYPSLYAYASEWNASAEVTELYNQILVILSEKYHLTEAQAIEIANTSNDVVYTKMVKAIIAGEKFGSWDQQTEPIEEKPVEKLPDKLPEEEGLKDAAFVDNK